MKWGGSGVDRRASRCIVDDHLDDDAGLVALERLAAALGAVTGSSSRSALCWALSSSP